jgi:nucleoside triphosphate pyrophosphatase
VTRTAGPLRLVLASASPRRRDLLSRLGLEFEVRPVNADETPRPGEAPEALALRLARAKAVAAARPGEIVIGADTVVAADGELLGKPADAAEAEAMLRRLSGRCHDVWTGVAVVRCDAAGRVAREAVRACRTEVTFRRLGAEEIAAYAATEEPLDKAGAYAIQGGAAAFVDRVDGDHDNVVGLPLTLVGQLLAETNRSFQ